MHMYGVHICYGKFVFLVSLAFVYYLYALLRAYTFHVNSSGLCIFTGYYAYSPKIHTYRNTL